VNEQQVKPGKWQIRIMSREPTVIEDKETVYEPDLLPPPIPVIRRMYTLVRRTSYMVNGPNREVWWALDRWDWGRGSWECVMNGKSRLRKGSAPS